jgi:hypothetical protein
MLVTINGKCSFKGKTFFNNNVVPLVSYTVWDFSNSSGATLNNVNIIYDPSLNNVRLDWGDGTSPEKIDSGTNYSHTLN